MNIQPYYVDTIIPPLYKWKNWGWKDYVSYSNYPQLLHAEMGFDSWFQMREKMKVITVLANSYNAPAVGLPLKVSIIHSCSTVYTISTPVPLSTLPPLPMRTLEGTRWVKQFAQTQQCRCPCKQHLQPCSHYPTVPVSWDLPLNWNGFDLLRKQILILYKGHHLELLVLKIPPKLLQTLYLQENIECLAAFTVILFIGFVNPVHSVSKLFVISFVSFPLMFFAFLTYRNF